MATTIEQETINESETRTESVEKIVEGLDLARFDSHSPEYHLLHPDAKQIKEQYEASLTDPRRI